MKKILYSLVLLTLSETVLSQSIDSEFANPTALTDKQLEAAKNFNHEGHKQNVYEQACAAKDKEKNTKSGKSVCNPSDSGIDIEAQIGKAYAMLGLMSGGLTPKISTTVKNKNAKNEAKTTTEGKDSSTNGKEKKDKSDYCMMAAMGYEALSGLVQSQLQQKSNNSAEAINDVQLQSLLSLKQTHVARQKTAQMQAAAYGAVSLCYGAMAVEMTIKGVKPDWKFWAKMGGAGALSTLYLVKINKHKNAATVVQEVIDQLPKVGSCNPWTGTSCFCKESSSKDLYPVEYQEVCILNNGNFDTPKIATGCAAVVNNNLEFDKECKCKTNNSCLKSNLRSYNPKLTYGNNLMNEANKGFDLLDSGNFDQAKLNAYTTNAAALSSKIKSQLDKTSIPKTNLTLEQQKMADSLSEFMPKDLAAVAASTPSSSLSGVNEETPNGPEISKLPNETNEKVTRALKINYEQGSGPNQTDDSAEFKMPNLTGEPKKEERGSEILTFSDRAIEKADVSNSPTTPIFDIISNRYKRSGWNKLKQTE